MRSTLGSAAYVFLIPALVAGSTGTTVRIAPSQPTVREQQALATAFELAVKQYGQDVRLPAQRSEVANVEIRVLSVLRQGGTEDAEFEVRQGNTTMPLRFSYQVAKRDAFLKDFVQKALPAVLSDLAAKDGKAK